MPVLTVVAEQVLAPVPGGTGRYARQIVEALARQAPDAWRVRTVTAWHRNIVPALVGGVDGPHRMPVGARVIPRVWSRGLPPWPRGSSIHATTPLAPSNWGPSHRGLVGKRPVVVTVHDTVPWSHPETLTPRGVSWHREMIGRAVDGASALVVPTRIVADELANIFPTAESRIRVISHGVTAMPMPADAPRRAAELGLPGRYLLSVATLEPRKGLDILIQAFGKLQDDPDLYLVIVGQVGWGNVDLQRWAVDSDVSPDRLILLGRLSDHDLAVVLARAIVVVCPSRAEGFGLPVLEGFAAGTPVVCSDAPALVEIAAGAALVVPRGDPAALACALHDVCADRATRQRMSAAGLRRASAFTWQAAASQLWSLHQSLA